MIYKHTKRVSIIIALLKKEYQNNATALKFTNPLQILVATILSAQCTDKRVNIVTRDLFKKYRTIKDYTKADRKKFEHSVKSTGFYKQKTKNIINAAQAIMRDFEGRVPNTMEGLLTLPGVARKTANIVLLNGYGVVKGIAVDTHVRRLSRRLNFSSNSDPVKIERDLMTLIPKRDWGKISNLLIEHGRNICHARSPKCAVCILNNYCSSFEEMVKK